MRLAIFGATGRTGKPLVEQALAAGDEVIALVRNPSKLSTVHKHLTVVPGDATDLAAVERALQGAEAVLSVMATSAARKIAQTQPLRRGTENILAAMKTYGVRRLIISSAGICQPNDLPDLRFSLLMALVKRIVPASYADTTAASQVVRAAEVEWTIVRMPLPTNGPQTGRVQAGYVNRAIGLRIARADAAAFMLNEVRAGQYVRQAPVICSR